MKPRKAALIGVTLVTPALTATQASARIETPAMTNVASDSMLAQQMRLKTELLSLAADAKREIAGDRIGSVQLAEVPANMVAVTKGNEHPNGAQSGATGNGAAGRQADTMTPSAYCNGAAGRQADTMTPSAYCQHVNTTAATGVHGQATTQNHAHAPAVHTATAAGATAGQQTATPTASAGH